MENVVFIPVTENTYREISKLLEKLNSKRSVNATIQQFIEYGLENAGWKSDVFFPETVDASLISKKEGFRWKHPDYAKPIFLPNGTQLKMEYDSEDYFASIANGNLMFRGESYESPSKLASTIASGTSRSAPRDFFIKRPSDIGWTQAIQMFIRENS